MAAVLLYALAAFVVHTGFLFSPCLSAGDGCPSLCHCLGSIVDCSKRGLTEIPTDLPVWVKQLDFQGNELTSLPDNAFQGLEKLEKLTLSHNRLRTIPVFPRGCNLTHLELGHNDIENVSAEALRNLQKLRILEMHFNQLSALPVGSFPPLPSLHHLFIQNNKIERLEPGVFDNLTSLEWLKLGKNKLTTLPKEMFSNLTKLKTLDLNRNKFRSIQGLTFNGMNSLETLKLRRNQITELAPGAFYEMKKIEILQLDHNNIGAVTKGWLFGLKTLKQLSLSHSNITRIDADCWDHLEALEELDLTANKLTTINEHTFIRLKALKELKLNNNTISVIEEGAFSGLAHLEALEMNYNEISWTNENMNGAFDGLTSLNRLELDSNRIKSIGKRAFSGLDHLQHLNLDDNAINSIQLNAFSVFSTLKELRLNSSNLVCDCRLSWLPKWLKDLGFDSSVNGLCAHPENLQGRSIFAISLEEFDCDDYLRPKIIRDLVEQKVILGSNVTLLCEAASSSNTPMVVLWKKNDVIWKNGEVETFAQTTDGELTKVMSRLHIGHVDYSAEGTYQCVISNELGTTYSKKATIVVQVYPWFTKKPGDITVRAGAVARLECAANGVPPPEISWKKVGQDFPAARERRIHMMERGDTVFIIREVKTRDQGVYSCTATSDAGLIVANATVQVQEVPAFVESMEDKTSAEGETAVVECLSSGSPKPKISWLKDGQALPMTDRHFFTADNQLLIIMKTEASDSGAYTCEMTNTLGTERGTSYLTVHGGNSGDQNGAGGLDDESTTTGIIIIAVVCCVVGTSLVWVIIIYQTRKKTEEYSSTPTDETTLPGEGPGTPYNSSDRDSRSSPGPLPPPHFSGSFSHMEDDQHQAMLPPTDGDADGSASSSLAALHRLVRSDADTDHSSSSPSSRSTHSTGLLHTFHPYATGGGHGSQQGLDGGGVEACTSATELLQSYPGAMAVAHTFPHSSYSPRDASRSRSVPHAPRPPEQRHPQVDPRDYHISSSNSHLPCATSEIAAPTTQSLPIPPQIPKDQQVLSRPPPPVPPHHPSSHLSHPGPGLYEEIGHPAPQPHPVYTVSPSSSPSVPTYSSASLGRQQHQQHQQHPYTHQQPPPHLYHQQQPHQLQHHHHQQQQQLQSREGSLSAIPNHLASESLSNSYHQLPNRTS